MDVLTRESVPSLLSLDRRSQLSRRTRPSFSHASVSLALHSAETFVELLTLHDLKRAHIALSSHKTSSAAHPSPEERRSEIEGFPVILGLELKSSAIRRI